MEALIFLFFLLLFAVVIFGMFSVAEGGRSRRRVSRRRRVSHRPRARSQARSVDRTRSRGRQTAAVSPSARSAMQQAGYAADQDYVQIMDIGLLAYRNTAEPRLMRQGDLMIDTEYLRPFVEMWVPFRSRGPVRFELLDGDGRIRYADEERYDLEPGGNTLLPGTWLPLSGKVIEAGEEWLLRVSAGKMLLALHDFGWQSVGGGIIQDYVESDGEISPELRQMIQHSPQDAVSLSELLSGQEDD